MNACYACGLPEGKTRCFGQCDMCGRETCAQHHDHPTPGDGSERTECFPSCGHKVAPLPAAALEAQP